VGVHDPYPPTSSYGGAAPGLEGREAVTADIL